MNMGERTSHISWESGPESGGVSPVSPNTGVQVGFSKKVELLVMAEILHHLGCMKP